MSERLIHHLRQLQDALDDEQIGEADRRWVEAQASALARLAQPLEALPPPLSAEIAAALQRAEWTDTSLITALLRRAAQGQTRIGEALALATDATAAGHLLRVRVRLFPGTPGASTAQRWPDEVIAGVAEAIQASLDAESRLFHARWELLPVQDARLAHVQGASLGLAAAVAARAALEGRAVPRWGFTGEVGLDGGLRPVGALPIKIRAAAAATLEKVVFPGANLPLPQDIVAHAAATGLGLLPVLGLRQVWRALGWVAVAPDPQPRRQTGRRAVGLGLAGVLSLLAWGASREPDRLEMCLAPARSGAGAALHLTARSSRPGEARAYLQSQDGAVTQIAMNGAPIMLGADPVALVSAAESAGVGVILESSDEAILVLWGEAALPPAGEAIRLVRDPTLGARGGRPLRLAELVPAARPGCLEAPLGEAGELALYRLPLWEGR